MADPVVMPSFGKTLALAVGLAFVIEGLFYAICAGRLTEMLQHLAQLPAASVRRLGFLVAGAGLVWMVWVKAMWFGGFPR